jgi:hypothetical protein
VSTTCVQPLISRTSACSRVIHGMPAAAYAVSVLLPAPAGQRTWPHATLVDAAAGLALRIPFPIQPTDVPDDCRVVQDLRVVQALRVSPSPPPAPAGRVKVEQVLWVDAIAGKLGEAWHAQHSVRIHRRIALLCSPRSSGRSSLT